MNERERRQQQHQTFIEHWEILTKRISALQEALILETQADERFRLETLIKKDEQERQTLEAKLNALEQRLTADGEIVAPLEQPADTKTAAQEFVELTTTINNLLQRLQISERFRPRDEFTVHNADTLNTIHTLKTTFEKLPTEAPDYYRLAIRVASALSSNNQLEQAETLLKTAQVGGTKDDKALATFNRFHLDLRRGEFNDALENLRIAQKLDPRRYALHDISKYPIERLIGAGGMGCVFLCRHRRWGLVAVKCCWEAAGSGDVFEEIDTLDQLPDDYVPAAYDHGYVDFITKDRPYLVTEYIADALNGEQWLGEYGPLTLDEGLQVGLHIARALATAHSKGICHLDLKPANLLLKRTDDGIQVKLIDFGLSRMAKPLREQTINRHPNSGQTMLGQAIFGTQHYAPPEQLGFEQYGQPGTKSDLYAFGKTLYRMVTNREAADNLRRRDLRDWPDPVFELLEDCILHDPSERPESANELIMVFERALQPSGKVVKILSGSLEEPSLAEMPVSVFEQDLQLDELRKIIKEQLLADNEIAMSQKDYIDDVENIEQQVLLEDSTPSLIAQLDELNVLREQNLWAAQLDWDKFGIYADFVYQNVTQRMRWVEPGTFLMGSLNSEEGRKDAEGPRHKVTLTQGFWLGDTPCTQALWQAVMGNNPSAFKGETRPVEKVSWHYVQAFLEKLYEISPDFAPCLPTEAQWEYACRANSTGRWCFGNDESLLDKYAWYYKNSNSETQPVKQKRPNAFGLYDLHGNVWEWCQDYYSKYSSEHQTNPIGHSTGNYRVLRGGSWDYYVESTRCAHRLKHRPDSRYDFMGFRLARS